MLWDISFPLQRGKLVSRTDEQTIRHLRTLTRNLLPVVIPALTRNLCCFVWLGF